MLTECMFYIIITNVQSMILANNRIVYIQGIHKHLFNIERRVIIYI